MWNSKQQPLLKEDHLASQEAKDRVQDVTTSKTETNTKNRGKKKRYSQSFHNDHPPINASP